MSKDITIRINGEILGTIREIGINELSDLLPQNRTYELTIYPVINEGKVAERKAKRETVSAENLKSRITYFKDEGYTNFVIANLNTYNRNRRVVRKVVRRKLKDSTNL